MPRPPRPNRMRRSCCNTVMDRRWRRRRKPNQRCRSMKTDASCADISSGYDLSLDTEAGVIATLDPAAVTRIVAAFVILRKAQLCRKSVNGDASSPSRAKDRWLFNDPRIKTGFDHAALFVSKARPAVSDTRRARKAAENFVKICPAKVPGGSNRKARAGNGGLWG